VREHRDEHSSEWAAIQSIAGKLGMTPEALRLWVRRDEVDHEQRPGGTTAEREREVRELRRANQILKVAEYSDCFNHSYRSGLLVKKR
jgi:transposase